MSPPAPATPHLALSPRARTIATAILVGLGLWLALPHQVGGPALVFAIASIFAAGTPLGVALGALTTLAGLATVPVPAPTAPLFTIGAALAGVGLGLFARELDRVGALLRSPLALATLLAVIVGVTLALPDTRVLLAAPDGQPLMLPAIVFDGATFTRLSVDLPAVLALSTPGGSLPAIALTALAIAAVILSIARLRGGGEARLVRGAWELTTLAAALAALVGLLGLLQGLGLFGEVALSSELLRQRYDLALSHQGGVLDLVAPPFAELALWSRPWVDGLRLLAASALLALTLRELRATRAPASTPLPPTPPTPETSRPSRLVPLALAAAAAGTALIAAQRGLSGPALALLGGLVLGAGALVALRLEPRAPHPLTTLGALAAGGATWVYAWLVTPLFGA